MARRLSSTPVGTDVNSTCFESTTSHGTVGTTVAPLGTRNRGVERSRQMCHGCVSRGRVGLVARCDRQVRAARLFAVWIQTITQFLSAVITSCAELAGAEWPLPFGAWGEPPAYDLWQ